MTVDSIVLVIGGTLTGILGGVFYAFSVAIVPALRSMKSTEHITAMQLINEKIKNPAFLLSFLGPTLLLPLAAFMHRDRPQFMWLVTAAVVHICGASGVTIAGNLRLNAALARVDVHALSDAQAEKQRAAFQGNGSLWMRLHTIRTAAAVLATVLVLVAVLSEHSSE